MAQDRSYSTGGLCPFRGPEAPRNALRTQPTTPGTVGPRLVIVKVTLLYFDDCPSWQTADGHLRALADELGYTIERIEVTTPEQAEQLRFRGSPSVHIDGTDLFAASDAPVGLSCRIYQTPEGPAGSPTIDQLRATLASM